MHIDSNEMALQVLGEVRRALLCIRNAPVGGVVTNLAQAQGQAHVVSQLDKVMAWLNQPRQ